MGALGAAFGIARCRARSGRGQSLATRIPLMGQYRFVPAGCGDEGYPSPISGLPGGGADTQKACSFQFKAMRSIFDACVVLLE